MRNEGDTRHYIVQDSLNGDPTISVQALQRFIDSANLENALLIEVSAPTIRAIEEAAREFNTGNYAEARKRLNAAKPMLEQWRKNAPSQIIKDALKSANGILENLAFIGE